MAALTIQERLLAAECAYHDLMTGRSARVVVDQNGERVEFTAANAGRLQAYIDTLKAELSSTKTRCPLGVYF